MEFKISRTMEQFLFFIGGPIFDGDLVSKEARDRLEEAGLIIRANGYQALSVKGIETLISLGYLNQ